jgi:hypothetical protein
MGALTNIIDSLNMRYEVSHSIADLLEITTNHLLTHSVATYAMSREYKAGSADNE